MKTVNLSDQTHALVKERAKWEGMMIRVYLERLIMKAFGKEKIPAKETSKRR